MEACYHLLENDRWDDKHSGEGKDFSEEARRVFPRTVAFIEAPPVHRESAARVIFGVEANDHAPLHRDTEPGSALTVAQSISFCSARRTSASYLADAEGGQPHASSTRAVYWFNDMDYHGVLADPFFRYSVRVDGVFTPAFERSLRAKFG